MTIAEYIEKTGITYRQFAKDCDLSPSMLYRLKTGERGTNISLSVAQKVVKGTKGKVTLDDLLSVFKK
jgi:transcriptional regulator with XRE-family HTH domain